MWQDILIENCYYLTAYCLSDFLPYIPELEITDDESYYGRIYTENGKYKTIKLSHATLGVNQDDIGILIYTICHEFAHMFIWEHGAEHERLTDTFVDLILIYLDKKNREVIQ